MENRKDHGEREKKNSAERIARHRCDEVGEGKMVKELNWRGEREDNFMGEEGNRSTYY